MATTMRAERFYADTKTVAVEDVPIPEPGPGEVLVKVAFCGNCLRIQLMEQAAILADAVSTPFGAVVRTGKATLVSRGRLDIPRSISEVVSLEDIRVGIEKLEHQDGNPIRILVRP